MDILLLHSNFGHKTLKPQWLELYIPNKLFLLAQRFFRFSKVIFPLTSHSSFFVFSSKCQSWRYWYQSILVSAGLKFHNRSLMSISSPNLGTNWFPSNKKSIKSFQLSFAWKLYNFWGILLPLVPYHWPTLILQCCVIWIKCMLHSDVISSHAVAPLDFMIFIPHEIKTLQNQGHQITVFVSYLTSW